MVLVCMYVINMIKNFTYIYLVTVCLQMMGLCWLNLEPEWNYRIAGIFLGMFISQSNH